jgi:Integrase zinc binding domain
VGNNDVKRGVISLFHDTSTAGHPGITKTLLMTAKYYWWLGMKEFTTNYVKGCAMCQMTKVNTHPTKPALFPITAEPNALPFQTIAVDFIIKLPTSDGYDSILTITDHDCSKAAIFLPCNESIDAPGVAELYARQVFLHYGIPHKIISDRDPRFAANFTTELCKTLGIKQNISSAYHPQTDRQSECTNQSLEQYLQAFCRNNQDQWAKWLPIAQYTKNSWPHATTKKTPYNTILGYTPIAHQLLRETDIPTLDKHIDNVQLARKQAQEAMSKAQEGLVKTTKFKEYEEGGKVWLEGMNIKRPYDSPKLSPR